MKQNKIAITYKSQLYILHRTASKHYQIGFETDRWSIHIYMRQDSPIRIIINKSVKKSETEYHTQFCYDCYCSLDKNGLYLNDVSDPATCRKIKNMTKWFTIEPMLREIYNQLKDEIALMQIQDSNEWWNAIARETKAIISGISTQVSSNEDYLLLFWDKLAQADKDCLFQYWQYRKGIIKLSSDDANSLQMEVICELAEIRLENLYKMDREQMYDESGNFYEKYQDSFNDEYDDIEDRLINNIF